MITGQIQCYVSEAEQFQAGSNAISDFRLGQPVDLARKNFDPGQRVVNPYPVLFQA